MAWNKINKVSTKWEAVGTILWSWRNKPWLSTYYPWQEDGGDVETNYDKINKPNTTYSNISKTNL